VASVFAAAAVAGGRISLFEDGQVIRDFLHVEDAVSAVIAVLDSTSPPSDAINIGSGVPTSLRRLAEAIADAVKADLPSFRCSTTGQTRKGDLRACVADVTRAKRLLGWAPAIPLEVGVVDLIDFVKREPVGDTTEALRELAGRNLLIRGSA
jgi:dTDP-L-rhamnose 4-epimerase